MVNGHPPNSTPLAVQSTENKGFLFLRLLNHERERGSEYGSISVEIPLLQSEKFCSEDGLKSVSN